MSSVSPVKSSYKYQARRAKIPVGSERIQASNSPVSTFSNMTDRAPKSIGS